MLCSVSQNILWLIERISSNTATLGRFVYVLCIIPHLANDGVLFSCPSNTNHLYFWQLDIKCKSPNFH
jgi:hypothetical protein